MCCRDRPRLLAGALDVLQRVVGPDVEVIVVDSASTSDEVRRAGRHGGARVLRSERPGLARARNVGWRAARAPVVAFTDDDCRPTSGWDEVLVAGFAGPEVGFVTGRVEAAGEGPAVSVLRTAEPADFDEPSTERVLGHGANMAFRRAVLDQLGGFDELLGVGAALGAGEDTDAFRRALSAGWRGRYLPDAMVVHEQWRSRPEMLRTEFRYGVGEGALAVKARRTAAPWPQRPVRRALRQLVVDARARYEFGMLADVARSIGAVEGMRRARRLDVLDGRFVP